MKNAEQPIHPLSDGIQEQFKKYAGYNSDSKPSLFGTGLTKREYFAAMAMQGLVGNSNLNKNIITNKSIITTSISLADELLKQLETL